MTLATRKGEIVEHLLDLLSSENLENCIETSQVVKSD
jgi:hypothetical protein